MSDMDRVVVAQKAEEPIVGSATPDIHNSGSARVVEATGSVDLLTASELAADLRAALAEKTTLIVVDLRQVDFLATAGMSVLAAADRRARAQGMTLLVMASTHAVGRALAIIGLTLAQSVLDNSSP